MKPGPKEPIAGDDLKAQSERGRTLWKLERMLQLAHEVGLPRVGAVEAEALLPLAAVDSGGHSGQVTFFRWQSRSESGGLDVAEAMRWLVVPILLEPDRVLENEQFLNQVVENSEESIQLSAFITAAEQAREYNARGRWRIYPWREEVRKGTRRIPQTRVYMFGATDDSPDLEVVVSDPKRRDPPQIVTAQTIHPPGAGRADPIQLKIDRPNAMTVCRAMARGQDRVVVRNPQGAQWHIRSRDGNVVPVGGP